MRLPSATRYRWLWTAGTSSALGDGISLSLVPLLMTGLTRDPLLVAILPVAGALPWAVFGLHAGALVDRWDRARVLMVADRARAILAVALIVVVLLHALTVVTLLIYAVATGIAAVLFRAAYVAILPTLVHEDALASANSRLKSGETITGTFVGPSLGSIVFAISAWLPVLGEVAAYSASAWCLARLPRRVRARPRTGLHLRTEIRQGLHHIWTDHTLRAIAAGTILQGAATSMLHAVFVLYSLQILHAPAAAYGVLLTIYAMGSLAGATIAGATLRRLGGRHGLLIGGFIAGACVLGLASTTSVAVAATGMGIFGLAAMIVGVIEVTIRQQRTPERLLGRVSNAFSVLTIVPAPICAPLAGAIAARYSIPTVLGACGIIYCTAALTLLAIPRRPATTTDALQRHQTNTAPGPEPNA